MSYCCLKFIMVYVCFIAQVAESNAIDFNIYGANKYQNINTLYSGEEFSLITCSSNNCVRLKHNGSIVGTGVYTLSHSFYPIVLLDDAGLYTCESANVDQPLNLEKCNSSNNYLTSDNKTVVVIDSSLVNVPLYHFVYVNESISLICDSATYQLTVNKWTKDGGNDTIHSGIINNAILNDEGNYTCSYSIYNDINYNKTELIVLVRPVFIATPTNLYEIAVGPIINNYTVKYSAKSPGNAVARWYHNNTSLFDRIINTSHDMGGSSTLQVYQRSHGGEYRVIVESMFNGLPVNNNIIQQSTIEYTFNINVVVPPSVPTMSLLSITPFEATILLTHNNITPDDAPDIIILTLIDNNNIINIAELVGHYHTQHTFHNLIPSKLYRVSLSVSNTDGEKDGETITLTTNTSEPSLSSIDIIRTDLRSFNVSILYNYLGAVTINGISIGYRPVYSITQQYQFIDITQMFDDHESLYNIGQFAINDTIGEQLEFIIHITNSDNKMNTVGQDNPITERIESLSAPSGVSITSLSTYSVSLIVVLPSLGTPPITTIQYLFTSSSHVLVTNITGYYIPDQQHSLIIEQHRLMADTRYTVSVRARNLVGWSNYSIGHEFTTYPADPNDNNIIHGTTDSIANDNLPIWSIILSGVIPSITVVLIIISTILFVLLIKKYRKKPKGYPINEVTAADKNRMDRSPGESRRIGKFFSYEKPLMPRPPTAEPFDMYPYPPSSSHDDSDSETNLTNTPKYKYVVSPTPNEIGIQGFLGSAPGSGTFVYV